MRFTFLLCVAACIAASSRAQTSSAPPPDAPGTVTGHILCGDTQRPARVAEVRLVPVPDGKPASKETGAAAKAADERSVPGDSTPPVETDMSGEFTIGNVKPGRYYLRADLQGYVSPLLRYSSKELREQTPAVAESLAREVQILTVRSKETTQTDLTLLRGGTIDGTVIYDDGTPAIGLGVGLMQKNSAGKLVNVSLSHFYGGADDHGHYHFDSLPAGDYVVQATLALTEHSFTTMPMPTGGEGTMFINFSKSVFSLPVYSGNALRQRDAVAVKLEAGAQAGNQDITIPLSKLHRVSGAVLAKDGHNLNSAKVALLQADDRSEVTDGEISREDNQFHFPYVPEGNYILKVDEARDVTDVEIPNAPGVTPKFRTQQKTVRSYAGTEQPLMVESDIMSVLATVAPQSKSAADAVADSK